MKIAAIQMNSVLADVFKNLKTSEKLGSVKEIAHI